MCTLEEFNTLYALDVSDKTEKRKAPDGNSKELTYLSWTWAWAEFKKVYPEALYEIKKFPKNEHTFMPYMYDENTGYMVMTSVTAGGLTYEMWLPVMNSNNKAMKAAAYTYKVKEYKLENGRSQATGNYIDKTVEAATMFDINKTIMRCLVKNLAMFGLGLYIYAGEDLPEGAEPKEKPVEKPKYTCSECGKTISEKVKKYSESKYKCALCMDCQNHLEV